MFLYQILSLLIVFCAAFSYINYRFIKWPPTIGIMVLSLCTSVLLLLTANIYPPFHDFSVRLIAAVDFHTLLMKMMLSFLLFAGGFHLNAQRLAAQKWPILVLATAGTVMSTFLVGGAFYYLFAMFGQAIPFIICLLFGTLISPTDPIAVLAILKKAGIPKSLELKIAGESLFNDGVAVVLFTSILNVALSSDGSFEMGPVAWLFVKEAFGGAALGALLGWLGFLAMESIDDYKIETLITVALVMGGYLLADVLHLSGPIAMVIAGIITGNTGKQGKIDHARDYVGRFWELVDEILNAVLFLLIGLEMLVIAKSSVLLGIGAIGIVVVLFARWVSVTLPVLSLRRWLPFERHAIALLTWGGLRGGLSVAMALSLPAALHRDAFVTITYVIVIFSIIVQGLTIGRLGKLVQPLPSAAVEK
jgi:CPA1 family monovalent cation:H+ antiporter